MKKALSIIILFTCLLFHCKQPVTEIIGVITFLSGDVKLNDLPVSTGTKININDTISTGVKSIAIIQFDDKALVTLQSNTLLKINSAVLSGAGEYELFQQSGTIYNKIKNGTQFRVKTPTLVASVRGTSFSINCDGTTKKTRCSVLNGVVAVTNLKTAEGETSKTVRNVFKEEEIIVNAGYQTIQTDDKIAEPIPIDEVQKNKLATYNKLVFIDNPVDAKDTSNIKDTPFMKEEVKQELLNDDSLNNSSTNNQNGNVIEHDSKDKSVDPIITYKEKLEKIKFQNNGKLDVIVLSNGKRFLGKIIERGAIFKIYTPNGIYTFSQDEIESQNITF